MGDSVLYLVPTSAAIGYFIIRKYQIEKFLTSLSVAVIPTLVLGIIFYFWPALYGDSKLLGDTTGIALLNILYCYMFFFTIAFVVSAFDRRLP